MNRKSGSGSGPFLMEMIVVVFFFMLCASTCILAFARSDRMSRLATNRNQAVSTAQSIAEIWKLEGLEGLERRMSVYESPVEKIMSRDRDVLSGENEVHCVCLDADWQYVTAEAEPESQEYFYIASFSEQEEESGIKKLQIHVWEDAPFFELLFELKVSRYEGTGG